MGRVLNVVAVVVKRRRITVDRGKEFLLELGRLNVRIAPPPAVADFPHLQGFAASRGLTAYDAAYLDLAMRLSLPLASMDDQLRAASLREGLEVLGQT